MIRGQEPFALLKITEDPKSFLFMGLLSIAAITLEI